ncbi:MULTISPECIES: BREX-2 system adenine-specific DNA-methyltransferase PglX [unclassified Kitasatospora]|uniref:BREX-2 system adenine-specific DNA-methyltransferase PglX n=1 Tax=unclassified Kitasatospora TaxID=2633591 RepID=UPI0033FBE208
MDQNELLKDLRRQVAALEDDLRERSQDVPEFAATLTDEYQRARTAERTAATYESWREERITQAAVAWVLGTVFVRFCEDNGLIEWPWIAGPGERLAVAEERHEAHFRENPEQNDRDWLVAAFNHLAAANETAGGLFDRNHNPLWGLTPSFDAARGLLAFWRRRGEDGEAAHLFESDDWDTRFLGDLYQNLSEHARKTYALLQTPEFVEEFILDLTLEPAVEEFGLWPEMTIREGETRVIEHRGLRTIDPACGSGHFLLGMFQRLLAKHREAAGPGVDDWANVRAALEAVHGCDKNPFAVSVARFRLLVAALKAAELKRLDQAPSFPINIAVGDSLLHGRGVGRRKLKGKSEDDLFSALGVEEDGIEENPFAYATEDVNEFVRRGDLLGKHSYHVVVANPPYITVKDKQENENYRGIYDACSGTYALSVPFAQRIFELATRDQRGFTGQITANSFMKREFGKKLIEEFFRVQVKLTHVIDTSGAFIPGHGTPTVILIGRNTTHGWSDPIRAVLGVRGEPGHPAEAADGLVWRAIVDQANSPGSVSNWVACVDLARGALASSPWSLSGGGAAEVLAAIETGTGRLGEHVRSIGRTTATGADDAFFLPNGETAARLGDFNDVRELVVGDAVRDFAIGAGVYVRNPYVDSNNSSFAPEDSRIATRSLWPYRELLAHRVIFGKSVIENGYPWYCHLENYTSKLSTANGISFAFVSTHNHFALDRQGRLFNRTAPVIKLPEGATEEEHLGLLGVLNSSTACFWLKQVCHDKGSQGIGGEGFKSQAWERFYEFTGTKLQNFPLPSTIPVALGRDLDQCAQTLATYAPAAVASSSPTRAALEAARTAHASTRRRMIALQEELDWQVYGSYGLLTDAEVKDLTITNHDDLPEVALGERAFEIVLARKTAVDDPEIVWFTRHGSMPITEIPAHWPESYRKIVQRRIDTIEQRSDLALIERPECKRRWLSQGWEKAEADALRTWLLDRCERKDLWFHTRDGMRQPRTLTPARLADLLGDDPDFHAVAELYAGDHLGKPDFRLVDVLREVLADEHVPYLAALRHKDSGLRKREQWERVWEQQRREDQTGERLDIAVPPKYASTDFRKQSYWTNRGKLDVPKERFISYPDAGPEADPKLVLGWAGWDHRDRAQALINLVADRVERDNWQGEQLVPLLAGMQELLPWLRQWHGEFDAEWDGNPAADCQEWLDAEQREHHITATTLREWRPAALQRVKGATK